MWSALASRSGARVRRRLRRWLHGPPVLVVHHASYRLPLASEVGAPMSPRRADDALTWLIHTGVVRSSDVVQAAELPWEDAALVHDQAYLASLDRPDTVARILGAEAARVPVREILETWRRACGGTVEAARRVTRGGDGAARRAVNLLGGFHHAEPARGGGFCALNDVAIAVAALRRDGVRGQVLVIDLDAHPPDGIVACLGDDPELTVLSLSAASEWAVPPARSARVVDLRVPGGSGDEAYLEAVDALLVHRPRDPALVFYLAGADPLAGDRLGGLSVSLAGLRQRDERVLAAIGAAPLVVLPAGGYAEHSWRVLAGVTALVAGAEPAIPDAYDPHAVRTREVMRALDPGRLGGAERDDVLVTEAELLGGLGSAPIDREPRFLGYYTRHGLEHALTAYGYLGTLGRLGFSGIQLDLEAGNGGGPDRMRVSVQLPGRREVVVDLAASIKAIGPARTLFVEWLELRDPRTPFTEGRPRLPGQRDPGLGLAEETTQLLVRAAERLELDGLAFVPSHYHVAWIGRRAFVPVDPEARGRFRALCHALRDVPLTEATAQLAGPGWPTADGGRVRWIPVETMAPLSEVARAHLAAGEPAAAEAEARWREMLRGRREDTCG